MRKRTTTIRLQGKIESCKINVFKWHAEIVTLKAEYKGALIAATKAKIRERRLQAAYKAQAGDVKKVHTHETTANGVTTRHITIHITRNREAKATIISLAKKILKLQISTMKCASTISANTKIVQKRLAVHRHHLEKKVKCAAKQDKIERVLRGKMGSYSTTIAKLNLIRNDLSKRAAKLNKEKNGKAASAVEERVNVISKYVHDLQFKIWSVKWTITSIKGFNCDVM